MLIQEHNRVCPGRFLAEDSLWIAVATIIATLTISRARGEDGAEIIPDVVPVSTGVARSARLSNHNARLD